jgi:hypothetical protein
MKPLFSVNFDFSLWVATQESCAWTLPVTEKLCSSPGSSISTSAVFTGFDDKIVAMSAREMTVRKIPGFLAKVQSVTYHPTSSAATPTKP